MCEPRLGKLEGERNIRKSPLSPRGGRSSKSPPRRKAGDGERRRFPRPVRKSSWMISSCRRRDEPRAEGRRESQRTSISPLVLRAPHRSHPVVIVPTPVPSPPIVVPSPSSSPPSPSSSKVSTAPVVPAPPRRWRSSVVVEVVARGRGVGSTAVAEGGGGGRGSVVVVSSSSVAGTTAVSVVRAVVTHSLRERGGAGSRV